MGVVRAGACRSSGHRPPAGGEGRVVVVAGRGGRVLGRVVYIFFFYFLINFLYFKKKFIIFLINLTEILTDSVKW